MKLFFLVLIFVALTANVEAKKRCFPIPQEEPQCGENEFFNKCGTDKICEITCDTVPGEELNCPPVCVAGCFCKSGYVRDKNWNCIHAKDCSNAQLVCDAENHEIYSECGANACQNTCDNPTLSHVCRGICNAGCVCENGYIRNHNGNCIRQEDCPSRCPRHEEWTDCNFKCTFDKCSDLESRTVCRSSGCFGGCICENGLYRNDHNRCVPPESCPQTIICDKNERYVACSKVCVEKTCNNRDETICETCQSRCLCKKGFLRNINGVCVKTIECGTGDPCTLPINKGPCKAAYGRFGYDSTQKKCVFFTYGGCGGNNNNFNTYADCQKVCEKKNN